MGVLTVHAVQFLFWILISQSFLNVDGIATTNYGIHCFLNGFNLYIFCTCIYLRYLANFNWFVNIGAAKCQDNKNKLIWKSLQVKVNLR